MREMKAARLYQAGEPLKIESVPIPNPAANEILVQVIAATSQVCWQRVFSYWFVWNGQTGY